MFETNGTVMREKLLYVGMSMQRLVVQSVFHVNCGEVIENAFRTPEILDSTGVHIFIFTLNNRRAEEHQSDSNWRITIPPVRCSSQPFPGDSVGADDNDCS